MPILILTFKNDFHIDDIRPYLDDEPIVVDYQDIADAGKCTYAFSGGKLSIIYQGRVLQDISGVWLRRPTHARDLRLPVMKEHYEYSRSALERFTGMFYAAFPESVWVSDHYAILKANNKPLQQKLAAQLGFIIPETIYTTDPDAAIEFAHLHSPFIVKTLANTYPNTINGKHTGFYTRKIASLKDIQLDGLSLAPSIFQQPIEVKKEYRVTVVGYEVFVAAINSSDHEHEIRDWRFSDLSGNTTYTSAILPKPLEKKCIALTKSLGLNYGAIDIIEDMQGIFWFLEINPNGQWSFIEYGTGLPIGKSIANLLQGKTVPLVH